MRSLLGLRSQIVLALLGLMLLAFVPLFFAVASVTRATLFASREANVLSQARTLAVCVSELGEGAALDAFLQRQTEAGKLSAIRVAHADGTVAASVVAAGSGSDGAGEGAREEGRVVVPLEGGGELAVTFPPDELGKRSAPLVRLLALYIGLFAVALLTFAYFALTRLIVRPVEALSNAAERVALGARTLKLPRAGAQELTRLGESVTAMATRLIADEEAMRRKVDELTRTTAHLTETRAQLVRSERMASVGRLAAGVAHEIGNPIAALMGMQDLLLDGVDEETGQDFLRRMRKETERIHTVVRDLLDFARPDEPAIGSASGGAPPADVREVVEDVFALARPQKSFRDVVLRAEIDGAPVVRLPAARLTQVLLNLVLNAGAAFAERPGGGVVVVRAAQDAGAVRVEVEDDGPGVPSDLVDRVFEPFVTTKEVGEGTGLGLAVCRGLVESAGGSIAFDTTHAPGARVVIRLPSAEEPPAALAPPSSGASP